MKINEYIKETPNGGVRNEIWHYELDNGIEDNVEIQIKVETPERHRTDEYNPNSIITIYIGDQRIGYWSHTPEFTSHFVEKLGEHDG